MMFLMPLRHRGQSPRSAARNLFRGLVRDPAFYFGILLLIFLVIQWLNGPVELEYDDINKEWIYTKPPFPNLPFNADRDGARQVLIWFSSVVTAVLAIRHCLGPKSKYLLLRLLVINGALLSILGFLQLGFSPDKLFWHRPMEVFFFSTFGYPNHAGAFFLLLSAVNMGLLMRAFASFDDINHPILYSVTLILNIAGVYGSMCRAAMVLETLLIVFALIYAMFFLRTKIGFSTWTKIIATIAVMIGCAVFVFIKGGDFAETVREINKEQFAHVYDGDRAILADAAVDILQDYPWSGVGGWGFRRYVGLYMAEERWNYLRTSGRANVHNDAIQFLCEHGVIGFGLMAALALALLGHAIVRLPLIRRETESASGRQRSWFGSVSPCVWASFAAIAAMVVHSTIDLPFRSIANTLVWFILLACLPGFMPSKESSK
jgi:O-antigen ligase